MHQQSLALHLYQVHELLHTDEKPQAQAQEPVSCPNSILNTTSARVLQKASSLLQP